MPIASLLSPKKPLIMGILNLTPDSFSDGGRYINVDKAIAHALQMVDQGASIIDVGGESSRPGATPVSLDVELQRVLPVLTGLRERSSVKLSIDTSKPEVMAAAIDAGACLINDVNALQTEGAIEVVASSNVDVCLMHRQGYAATMQVAPQYTDILFDITSFFNERINACLSAGIVRSRIILDPGFGFGKTTAHNLRIINGLHVFSSLELPLLLGVSRKQTLGEITGTDTSERLAASLTMGLRALDNGASILRVHDVKQTSDMIKITQALANECANNLSRT